MSGPGLRSAIVVSVRPATAIVLIILLVTWIQRRLVPDDKVDLV